MLEEFVARFAAVEDPGVADVLRQLGRPRTVVVQLDGDQQCAIAVLFADAALHAMKLCRRGIADTQAFAGGHQPFAQLGITGQVQVELQACPAGLPAPQAKQRQHQARRHAVDQQHAYQPSRPGLAGTFDVQCGVATGADHRLGGHAEAEQGR
ncbi:hypothetical protein D3C76_1160190 [compost metagenome]